MVELTAAQVERFREDGFLVLDRFLEPAAIVPARCRFEKLFRGEFETGLYPTSGTGRKAAIRPI